MIKEPENTINYYKWKANRNLATKNGYQWFDIDFVSKKLIPMERTKLDVKRKLIEETIKKRVAGKSVIDIGCDKGYFAWCAMKYGAREVFANDLNDKLEEFVTIMCKTMKWPIKFMNKNLFEDNHGLKFDYVMSLAMIHQIGISAEEAVEKIREMSIEGSLIEFCEDYQYKFGITWNVKWFEDLLKKHYSKIELVATYQAIAEKTGTRYVYDCCCN